MSYLTNESLFLEETLPESLVIIGGGPIGVEMGQTMNRLGVKVTIIEMSRMILARDEEEFREKMQTILEKEGVLIIPETRAAAIEKTDHGIRLIATKNGEEIQVKTAESGSEALKLIQTKIFNLIITDLKMENIDGIDVLKEAMNTDPAPEVIVVTGYSSVETAVETIKLGAYDYISKPLDPKRIVVTVEKAVEKQNLKREVRTLREHLKKNYNIEDIIICVKRNLKYCKLIMIREKFGIIEFFVIPDVPLRVMLSRGSVGF